MPVGFHDAVVICVHLSSSVDTMEFYFMGSREQVCPCGLAVYCRQVCTVGLAEQAAVQSSYAF